ncbi:biotin--[acetyl-CoA-carboxylase] ligase [Candidatus Dependentiae bacterium]|nr:biotin--[acetyl-CoA-carboxylase] ligase [Candidatus Dependentiae bacterium]MBU4387463.1 biotin--[acetyl-CoA-carboxylase] ligase [Candidatus Dependentiae bacterium]MCG2756156.1 biotin--[acetyl-CoA-carboxylase] ligase [Candidatus Dependentiae bacterium]
MIIGSKVYHEKKIYNSLEWAKENMDSAPDGSIFIADEHEFTRGRQNRSWIFDKDQLVVTLLLKPKIFNNLTGEELEVKLSNLNMAITLGILEKLEKFNINLKWPNDFNYENYKVGGIISQVVWQEDKILGVIFGFAINVNNLIKDKILNLKAISLREISEKIINKEILQKDILNSIDKFYKKWLNFEFDNIFNIWRDKLSYLKNKNILIHKFDGKIIIGKFKDVLENGDMLFESENKIQEQISFNIVENVLIK